jgi:hypothetical protein
MGLQFRNAVPRFLGYVCSNGQLAGRSASRQTSSISWFNSSEERLARLLLLLANFGKEERPKISQETLADMIGTTRSR